MQRALLGRSGGWQRQPGGYRAFVPVPLPPDPPLEMDDEMHDLLSKADRFLGRLDGSIQTLPNRDLFVFMSIRKEAVLSSQIEGTQSSLTDLLEAEVHVLQSQHPRDVSGVLNYVRTMNYGLERLRELPVSVRLIRELHERLLEGVRGEQRQRGELRSSQNWVGPPGSTIREAVYIPPPPNYIADALGDLERFLHSEDPMPVLIKIGLAHAQFETIHPFLDGNGRIGRLLVVFLLCEREILQKPALYISYFFRRYRQQYFDLLQGTRETADWEAWLKFFLKAMIESAREAVETARRIVDLREQHRSLITERFGRVAANGLTVLETLFHRPLMTVNQVAELTGVSYPAASGLVGRFVEHGLLSEITGRTRNRMYRYNEYIEVFSESDGC